MNCTVKNMRLVFKYMIEHHADSQTGPDCAEFDDECNLLNAVKDSIEFLEFSMANKIDRIPE